MLTKISKISVLAERVIKNWRFEPSKIIKKSIKKWCKNRLFFWLIFYRFLVDVGPMLGPKILLKSIKNPLKNHFKKLYFFCWFYDDFWWILAPSWGVPGGPLEVHLLTLGGLDWLLGPRWPQDPPKRAPKTDFWTQHGPQTNSKRPNLAPTRPQLSPSWPVKFNPKLCNSMV